MGFVTVLFTLCVTAFAADCSVGGEGLCSCSELISLHLIRSFDDCTQSAAVSACKSGKCVHDTTNSSEVRKPSMLTSAVQPMDLPYSYHNEIGPLDMSWGFPSDDTIEIEFSLPSDFYVGLGLTANGVGDAVAGWVDETGKVHVGDYWDAGNRQPDTDESKGCKNDIETISGHLKDGVTTVRFRRKLDTGDNGKCDARIVRGPMGVNYAWCNAPWCFDYSKGCKGFADGCLDSPHSGDAANEVVVDFSGKGMHMLSTDVVV